MISEYRAAGKGAENKFPTNWAAVFKHSVNPQRPEGGRFSGDLSRPKSTQLMHIDIYSWKELSFFLYIDETKEHIRINYSL